MKSKIWKTTIVNACQSIGTYRDEYDSVIDTLASILEERDKAYKEYVSDYEGKVTYQYPNKIIGINPALNVWDSLNKSALSYWRDLGLTPSGLKKITNALAVKPKNKKPQTLEEQIAQLEHELDNEYGIGHS